jgi:hypothetical protein
VFIAHRFLLKSASISVNRRLPIFLASSRETFLILPSTVNRKLLFRIPDSFSLIRAHPFHQRYPRAIFLPGILAPEPGTRLFVIRISSLIRHSDFVIRHLLNYRSVSETRKERHCSSFEVPEIVTSFLNHQQRNR